MFLHQKAQEPLSTLGKVLESAEISKLRAALADSETALSRARLEIEQLKELNMQLMYESDEADNDK